jgi:hypothetical protein
MLPPIKPNAPAATTTVSETRVTPVPGKARFGEVMKNTVLAGAEVATQVLPGGPMMALALRGGGSAGARPAQTMSGSFGPLGTPALASTSVSPSIASSPALTTPVATSTPTSAGAEGPTPAAGGPGGSSAGSMDTAIAQSQEMNMYYLQIQEQVNAQNRSFTTLSNVLKAEHETVKTAIGNIR